jgi:hypothetical protein
MGAGRPSSIVAKFLSEAGGDTSPAQEEFMKGAAITGFAGEPRTIESAN